ncbi:MAG: type III-B CRISPR module RAMP protein Cmr6 [Acidobacteria bacterium]|nr:MAG: type III-B CRISPR module RAMP protein Cmr6 [Acidobacteriota bacterium]GIU81028.1 MAG: hypothetical protein KatS3mg006_0092 [Pyrinomonadaceae bacterium]
MPQQRPRQGQSGRSPQQPQETYPLPQDTRALAQSHAGQCLNYGLRIERLLPCNAQTWELTKQAKERQGVRAFNQGDLQRIVSAHKARWEAMLNDYRQRGYETRAFTMRAASRVIVGLGAESVLETSIRLHRIYGFPIIPGSALKDLARSYALWQVAEQLGVPVLSSEDVAAREKSGRRTPIQILEAYLDEPDEKRRSHWLENLKKDEAMPESAKLRSLDFATVEEKTKSFRSAFGTIGGAGQVIFFDAVPANPATLRLDLDVMNPHYSSYYQGGNTPPADYLNPVPVFFLAIAPDSEFMFAVASKNATLAQQAQAWLQAGLREMGIGAKTTAGYGLWR